MEPEVKCGNKDQRRGHAVGETVLRRNMLRLCHSETDGLWNCGEYPEYCSFRLIRISDVVVVADNISRRHALHWLPVRQRISFKILSLRSGPDDTCGGGGLWLFPLCKLFFAPNQKQTLRFFPSQAIAKEDPSFFSFMHITSFFCQFCQHTFYLSQFSEQTIFSSLFAEQYFFCSKKIIPPPTYHPVGP